MHFDYTCIVVYMHNRHELVMVRAKAFRFGQFAMEKLFALFCCLRKTVLLLLLLFHITVEVVVVWVDGLYKYNLRASAECGGVGVRCTQKKTSKMKNCVRCKRKKKNNNISMEISGAAIFLWVAIAKFSFHL
jgi:hypothetical protein